MESTVGLRPRPRRGHAESVPALDGRRLVAGRYGNGLLLQREHRTRVTAASFDFNPAIGAVEFWYQPHLQPRRRRDATCFWFWQAGVGHYAASASRRRSATPRLRRLDYEPDLHDRRAPLAVGAQRRDYCWRAYDWVHLKTSWNDARPLATSKLRIVMNGVEPRPPGPSSRHARQRGADLRRLQLELPRGRRRPTRTASSTRCTSTAASTRRLRHRTRRLAHAGLTSDAGEYLADPAKNWALGLHRRRGRSRGVVPVFRLGLAVPGPERLARDAGRVVDRSATSSGSTGTARSGRRSSPASASRTARTTSRRPGRLLDGRPGRLGALLGQRRPGSLLRSPPPRRGRLLLDAAGRERDQDRHPAVPVLRRHHGAAQQFQFAAPAPTAVKLQSFAALPGDGSVTLAWQTASELDNLGFHLYRALSEDGPWTRLDAVADPGARLVRHGPGLLLARRRAFERHALLLPPRGRGRDVARDVARPGVGGARGRPGRRGTGGDPRRRTPARRSAALRAPSCPDWVLRGLRRRCAGSPDRRPRLHAPRRPRGRLARRPLARLATGDARAPDGRLLRAAGGLGQGARVRARLRLPAGPEGRGAALPPRAGGRGRGPQVQLGGVRALEQQGFPGLVPAALGEAEMQVARDGTVRAARREAREPRRCARAPSWRGSCRASSRERRRARSWRSRRCATTRGASSCCSRSGCW